MAIDVICAPKTEELAPYHLFEVSDDLCVGGGYVYFLERDCAFRIEKVTYDLLETALELAGLTQAENGKKRGQTQAERSADGSVPAFSDHHSPPLKGAARRAGGCDSIFPLEAAADELILAGEHPREAIAGSLSDAIKLREAGLMRPPVNRLSEEAKERQLEHRFSTPRTKLELALAESCNLACTYCYCSAVRDMPNQGLMSEAVAKQAIDWLFEASADEKELGITLFGGEPLLNKPVFKFVMDYSDALAKERGKTIRYSMTTNGTLLDDMVINYIKKHDFGLMVSLDGPPEIHDAQCPTQGGAPSFDLAASGIKELMKRRKRVTVRCTLTNARPSMLELIKFFEHFGFARIVMAQAKNPVSPSAVDCTVDDELEFDRQEEEELLPWMIDQLSHGRMPKWFPYRKALMDPESDPDTIKGLSTFRCGACRGTMTVGSDGQLYPCHRFVGMAQFVIGCISDGPDPGVAADFWRRFDAAVDSLCELCWARRLCNRPCPWMVANQDGTFRSPDHKQCQRLRDWFEHLQHMRWKLTKEFPDIVRTLRGKTRTPDRG